MEDFHSKLCHSVLSVGCLWRQASRCMPSNTSTKEESCRPTWVSAKGATKISMRIGNRILCAAQCAKVVWRV